MQTATTGHSRSDGEDSGFRPVKIRAYSDGAQSFTGRRVDVLGRSLVVPLDADPAADVRDYLSAARTRSARAPAAKAVMLIKPVRLAGKVVWPGAGPAATSVCRRRALWLNTAGGVEA